LEAHLQVFRLAKHLPTLETFECGTRSIRGGGGGPVTGLLVVLQSKRFNDIMKVYVGQMNITYHLIKFEVKKGDNLGKFFIISH
jgi:hypothetical protein